MNEIEKMFYDACMSMEMSQEYVVTEQVPIGIYKVDFVIGSCAIEIDGHEWHKTKEQREYDYKRERYLIRQKYIPVRFTASEVFVDPQKCAAEAFEIAEILEWKDILLFQKGHDFGKETIKAGSDENV